MLARCRRCHGRMLLSGDTVPRSHRPPRPTQAVLCFACGEEGYYCPPWRGQPASLHFTDHELLAAWERATTASAVQHARNLMALGAVRRQPVAKS
jgi:hypothetical protein